MCIHVCIYVCMYIYIYIHTYIYVLLSLNNTHDTNNTATNDNTDTEAGPPPASLPAQREGRGDRTEAHNILQYTYTMLYYAITYYYIILCYTKLYYDITYTIL